MIKKSIDYLNLQQIADSGQCFRWKKQDDNKYSVIAYGKYVEIEQNGNEFTFSCDEQEWEQVWSKYFDMETDYGQIATMIMESGDEHLIEAYKYGSGVRILRQDLWEMMVSFMISQNNNIKRISNSVDMLCERCGSPIEDRGYAFPLPHQSQEEVFADKTMGFGYRDAYLRELYAYARENPHWLEKLEKMTYDQAMEDLLQRKGIGKKVANCICLFGLHHVEAFPIDTHVKQLLEKYYPKGFDFDRYRGVAGIIQQYLFYYELKG